VLIHTPRDLGAAIRDRRKAMGIDQTEPATRVGTSRRWLTEIEAGKPGASIGLLLRILGALGMQVTLSDNSTPATSVGEPLPAPDLSAVISRARRTVSPK
jgi:HTH-type transcriptional regulator/antitoxin HipB